VRLGVASLLTVAGVGAFAGAAAAQSAEIGSALQVAPEPKTAPGGVGCAGLAAKYGNGATWNEIRFSNLPAAGSSKTASKAGVTVTVTRLSPTTMAFTATDGIDLVFVNAGKFPNESNAVYRYDPPIRGASGLSGTVPSDIIDHVVLCFGDQPPPPPPTTAPPPPPTVTTAPPPPTTDVVRCANPPTCQIVRTTVPNPPPTAPPPTLPETGSDSTRPLVLAGVGLLGLGALVLMTARPGRRPAED
jgi:LPXTG-motif cell wall-anchored protein